MFAHALPLDESVQVAHGATDRVRDHRQLAPFQHQRLAPFQGPRLAIEMRSHYIHGIWRHHIVTGKRIMSRVQNGLALPEPFCGNEGTVRLRQSQEAVQTFFEDDRLATDPLAMGDRIYEVRLGLSPTRRKPLPIEQFAALIAEHAGMPPRSASTISRWELDEGVPSPAEAMAIAELGGVRLEWLVRGEEPKHRPPNGPLEIRQEEPAPTDIRPRGSSKTRGA